MAEMEDGLMTRCFVRGAGIAEGTGDMIGEIIGTEESNAHPLFYFVNHRGDTMAAYVQHDSTKTIAAEYRYDAFGNLTSSTTNEPAFLPRFTFSTKEYLAEAQLYLYAYRVYDPVAGRWTQRDPIDYQDSVNLYQFCGNNPLSDVDCFGLKPKLEENGVISMPVKFDSSVSDKKRKELIDYANRTLNAGSKSPRFCVYEDQKNASATTVSIVTTANQKPFCVGSRDQQNDAIKLTGEGEDLLGKKVTAQEQNNAFVHELLHTTGAKEEYKSAAGLLPSITYTFGKDTYTFKVRDDTVMGGQSDQPLKVYPYHYLMAVQSLK